MLDNVSSKQLIIALVSRPFSAVFSLFTFRWLYKILGHKKGVILLHAFLFSLLVYGIPVSICYLTGLIGGVSVSGPGTKSIEFAAIGGFYVALWGIHNALLATHTKEFEELEKKEDKVFCNSSKPAIAAMIPGKTYNESSNPTHCIAQANNVWFSIELEALNFVEKLLDDRVYSAEKHDDKYDFSERVDDVICHLVWNNISLIPDANSQLGGNSLFNIKRRIEEITKNQLLRTAAIGRVSEYWKAKERECFAKKFAEDACEICKKARPNGSTANACDHESRKPVDGDKSERSDQMGSKSMRGFE